ncbi:biotin holocarboxylase synthetase [Mortierella sp. AM989]|nr:biotin holocarboxylase synthetase [Mortierella sp. AM989]
MVKFNPFRTTHENNTSNSSVSSVQDKTAHHKRPSSSRRSSYESATQGNGVVLAKNERYDSAQDHGHHHSRPASVNATFNDGIVMESGWRGYLVVFGGFLIIMVAIGYVSIYGIFQSKYDEIFRDRGASASSISFVGSLAVGFQFGFTIISGPVMNRFGHKVVLWSGTIIGSLGLLLASWATELWHLYLTQGVMFGIGVSLLNLAATAIPPLWYDKHRGLAMGVCFCGAGVGGLVFGFLIPALIEKLGISWTLRIYAIIHFVCTAFASIVMRAPRQLSGPPIDPRKDTINLAILKDRGFIIWLLAATLFGFAYIVPFAYLPGYAKDIVGLDPNIQGGQLLSITSAANAVGRIVIGIAGDRLGAIRVAAFSFIAAGASCFVWMFAESFGALIGFSILYGFFSGAFFTLVASITANIVGLTHLGSGLTVIFLTNTPGNLFTLPIAGKMIESAADYKNMIGYNSAMFLSGGALLCYLICLDHEPGLGDSPTESTDMLRPLLDMSIAWKRKELKDSPMNILVYSGDGASRASVIHTINSLRSLVGQHYDVMKIDDNGLLAEPWEDSTSLLVIPGGRDLPYVRDLSGPTNDKIRNYVHSGGKFFGICAGAYYASDRVNFECGSPLEVQGLRDLKFFPGECRGAVYPGFVYGSEAGARSAGIRLNRDLFAKDQFGFNETKVYFNGGGYFVDAEKYPGTQILAWYSGEPCEIIPDTKTPKAAMIACQVGQGLAVLTGVHPEYDATNMDPRNPEYGSQPNVVTWLLEKEHERRVLLGNVLAKMGLKVMQSAPYHPNINSAAGAIQGIPAITPLYLASIQPSYTADLTRILSGLTSADHQIREVNDTFQLVQSLQHPVPVHTPTTIETKEGDGEEKVTKNIVLCLNEPPSANLTPEFDMSLYFGHLQQARQMRNTRESNSFIFGNSLMYGQVVTSTQTMLDKNFGLCQQLPDGFVCSATIQVAGRGRGRNSWISPPGCLQFSMVLRHPVKASHASAVFVQYLVALAVVEGVCSLPGYEDIPLRLKWPNDIYAEAPLEHPSQACAATARGSDGQEHRRPKMIKIGGVLVNSNFSESEFLLVIGCGVNTTNPNPTTSINHLVRYHNKVTGKNLPLFSQETLLAQVLFKFEQLYKQFLGGDGRGFAQFEEIYYKRWLHSNSLVTLTTVTPNKRVRIKGITLDYGLLRTVAVDNQERDIVGEEYRLQPDGNSFDMLKGLISQKS